MEAVELTFDQWVERDEAAAFGRWATRQEVAWQKCFQAGAWMREWLDVGDGDATHYDPPFQEMAFAISGNEENPGPYLGAALEGGKTPPIQYRIPWDCPGWHLAPYGGHYEPGWAYRLAPVNYPSGVYWRLMRRPTPG